MITSSLNILCNLEISQHITTSSSIYHFLFMNQVDTITITITTTTFFFPYLVMTTSPPPHLFSPHLLLLFCPSSSRHAIWATMLLHVTLPLHMAGP
jgi:hypothetical protein